MGHLEDLWMIELRETAAEHGGKLWWSSQIEPICKKHFPKALSWKLFEAVIKEGHFVFDSFGCYRAVGVRVIAHNLPPGRPAPVLPPPKLSERPRADRATVIREPKPPRPAIHETLTLPVLADFFALQLENPYKNVPQRVRTAYQRLKRSDNDLNACLDWCRRRGFATMTTGYGGSVLKVTTEGSNELWQGGFRTILTPTEITSLNAHDTREARTAEAQRKG